MKKIMTIVLAVVLVASLSSCGAKPVADTEQDGAHPYPNMILSKEQMLQDYDAMWSAMEENYPFFGVIDRRSGERDAYKTTVANYRKEIEDMELKGDEAMYDYIRIVAYSVYEVCGDPHVSIVNPNHFRSDKALYKAALGEMPEVQPWIDALEAPQVVAFYEYYDYLVNLDLQKEAGEEQENVPTTEEMEAMWEEEIKRLKETNLTIKILEEGKTAYIKVDSFDNIFIEDDVPKIHAFLREISAYKHLIIDISENGGGNAAYWEEAFVRPNISEPITVSATRLMKNTELTQRFYGFDYKDATLTVDAVQNNSDFLALPIEDLADLTLARALPYTYGPLSDEKMFQGQIWLLTGPDIYSAAESFAVFCKSTKFATLVGMATGGGNTGGPIFFELPISHILIQFDVEYCLNPDGSCSQERGTLPDIDSEDALKTTLDRIAG